MLVIPSRNEPSRPGQDLPPLVLFVGHTNAATSILAEAILRHRACGRVLAGSAGERAAEEVSPHTLACLRAHQIPTTGLRCKPWGEFFGLHRPPVRALIALCETYALGANWNLGGVRTVKALWPTPDPESSGQDEAGIRLAFEAVFATLDARIQELLALPLQTLPDEALSQGLARIGDILSRSTMAQGNSRR